MSPRSAWRRRHVDELPSYDEMVPHGPPWNEGPTKRGAELIVAERVRQISQEGWTAEHDDEHTDPIRNLVKAGALIAAEIDRLQRARDATGGGN